MKTENRGFCRLLTALLLTVLMIFASGASAEEGEGYEVYEDEDGQWYSVHVSEPDGNGGGKSILLEYDAALKLPEEEEDIVYDDYYLSGSMTVQDGETVKELPIRIKGRGNATFNYPKKPFTVKLESKTGLLGMEKSKKWVLLAGYCDKSLLRAALGFKVSELVGLEYMRATIFCVNR